MYIYKCVYIFIYDTIYLIIIIKMQWSLMHRHLNYIEMNSQTENLRFIMLCTKSFE